MVKVPAPPPRLVREAGDIVTLRAVLWRVHRTVGAHALPWDELRRYGPVARMRFDQHLPPARVQERAVAYTATDVATTLAEVFQRSRTVDVDSGRPALTGWEPVRSLRLLDLTGTWRVRNGAAGGALSAGSKRFTSAWARAIVDAFGDEIDGLMHRSALTQERAVTLYQPARSSFPTRPALSRHLADGALYSVIEQAATSIGYRVRGGAWG